MNKVFADLNFSDISGLITLSGVCVVLVVNLKQLLFPSRPSGQEPVKKEDLLLLKSELEKKYDEYRLSNNNNTQANKNYVDSTIAEIRNSFTAALSAYVTKVELQKLETKIELIAQSNQELSAYTYTHVKELMDKMNAMAVRIENMHHAIDKEMASDRDRILSKIDSVSFDRSIAIEKLVTRIEILSNKMASIEESGCKKLQQHMTVMAGLETPESERF